jgi:predicted TIM-barrel fold metal-dependent hydrolase
MSNNSQTSSQTQKKAVVSADGKTGTPSLTQKPVFIAAVDGHMHIQSGHCGTLPFGLGAKYPLGIRKLTGDIPNKLFYARFKRKYLDEDSVDFYIKTYKSSLEDIAEKTDLLSKKYKNKAAQTADFRKSIQNEIIEASIFICKLLQKLSTNYGKAVDEEQKTVLKMVSDNFEMLSNKAQSGGLILSSMSSNAKETSEAVEFSVPQAASVIENVAPDTVGFITGAIINAAGYIVDFHLQSFALFCDLGAKALKDLQNVILEVLNNIRELIEFFFQWEKNALKLIEQEIIKIIIESAPRIAQFGTIDLAIKEVWQKAASIIMAHISRVAHEKSKIGFGEFLAIQKEKTYTIGNKAVEGSNKSIVPICKTFGADRTTIFAPLMVMPMDLDFAHLDRFEQDIKKAVVYRYVNVRYWVNQKIETSGPQGAPTEACQQVLLPPETPQSEIQNIRKSDIVNEEKGDFYYFNSRLSGVNPGQLFWLHPTEFKVYEHWKIQRDDTINTVKNNPWKVVPLYHFEPRRYSGDCEEAFQYIMDKNNKSGNSKYPRLFIGIKLYPNLGYKPLDNRLPSLKSMYKKCMENEIPIMTHGSPNGAFTHDRPLYYESDTFKNIAATVQNKELSAIKGEDKALFYFMQEYASPYAWERVLKEYNNLRLCIAHFGGSDDRPDSTDKNKKPLSGWDVKTDINSNSWDETLWNQKIISMMQKYPNLYTDISCMVKETYLENLPKAIIRWPDLRKRILFGTDWYMTELSNLDYPAFINQAKEGLDAVDSIVRKSGKIPQNDPPVWRWFTEINPFRFYRFDRIAKEYTKELSKNINSDEILTDQIKPVNVKIAQDTCGLIYLIAKRLKTTGELPDAITGG